MKKKIEDKMTKMKHEISSCSAVKYMNEWSEKYLYKIQANTGNGVARALR